MKQTSPLNSEPGETPDQIKQERDFYKRIVENLPAVVHINNFNKQYVEWVNKTSEKFSGYPKPFMEKNPEFFNEVLVPEDVSWLYGSIDEIQQLNSDQIYASIYSMRHANGSVATYHAFSKVLEFDEKGNPLYSLGVDVDITNEIQNFKQLKRQVDELTKKLNGQKINLLTKTELAIVKLLCECLTLKQIADKTNRSPHTIDKHKRAIFKKLEINRIQQLMVWGKEVGLI